MSYKFKSLLYFGCLLAAIALYEVTSPEKENNTAVTEQSEFSELNLDKLENAETARIEFTQ